VLDWHAPATRTGRKRLGLVRDLLATRRREIVPRLAGVKFAIACGDGPILTSDWRLADGQTLRLVANLCDADAKAPRACRPLRSIWGGELPAVLPPWSVFWSIGAG